MVLDAVNRVVKSTFPLKYQPTTALMAPDALTIYVLSGTTGELTYYDVLSSTADLSVNTYTPGVENGYTGGNAFVHPDGTRLFWCLGLLLEVFDLTKRLVTSTFPSGLPNGPGVSLQVSQDGSTALMANDKVRLSLSILNRAGHRDVAEFDRDSGISRELKSSAG